MTEGEDVKLNPKKSIFISYSHSDADKAKVFARLCQKIGARTWLDTDTNVQPGENWKEKILDAIQTCNIIVVLISQDSQFNEPWQKREWNAICERHWTQPEVKVFPIRLDESKLPAFLRQMQAFDGRNRNELELCAQRISRFQGVEKSPNQSVISSDELEELKDRFRQVFEAITESSSEEALLNKRPEDKDS